MIWGDFVPVKLHAMPHKTRPSQTRIFIDAIFGLVLRYAMFFFPNPNHHKSEEDA